MKKTLFILPFLLLIGCGDSPEDKRFYSYFYENTGSEIVVSRVTFLGEKRVEFAQAIVHASSGEA